MSDETQGFQLTKKQALSYATPQRMRYIKRLADRRVMKLIIFLGLFVVAMYEINHYIALATTELRTGN